MSRIHTVRQDRAARTAHRLADATLTLLRSKPLAAISVAEIVAQADSSVGAFYARFTCKEALLDWLCEHRLTEAAARMEARLVDLDARGASIADVIYAYVDAAATFFETEAVLLREVVRLSASTNVRAVLGRTLRANARVDQRFIQRLTKYAGALAPSAAAASAAFSTVFVAATLRAYVLFPETLPPVEAKRRGVRLRRELAAWILARFAYDPTTDAA